MLIQILVPCYNEEEVLPTTVPRLLHVLMRRVVGMIPEPVRNRHDNEVFIGYFTRKHARFQRQTQSAKHRVQLFQDIHSLLISSSSVCIMRCLHSFADAFFAGLRNGLAG